MSHDRGGLRLTVELTEPNREADRLGSPLAPPLAAIPPLATMPLAGGASPTAARLAAIPAAMQACSPVDLCGLLKSPGAEISIARTNGPLSWAPPTVDGSSAGGLALRGLPQGSEVYLARVALPTNRAEPQMVGRAQRPAQAGRMGLRVSAVGGDISPADLARLLDDVVRPPPGN